MNADYFFRNNLRKSAQSADEIIYVRHHWICREESGLAHPARRFAAAGISRLRQRGRGFGVWRRPARAQEKGENRRGARAAVEIRAGRGKPRHRPHALGHARPALGQKFPSATRSIRQNRDCPQRRHRKLRRAQTKTAQSRAHFQIGHRHRGAGAFDRRLLRKAQNRKSEIGNRK